jgi:ATP sulfurylase/adenylyl-sulfate kinase
MSTLVEPHGGTLVDRIVTGPAADALRARAAKLPRIVLDSREQADLELIAVGAASPLTGFLREADYRSVLERLRLADGTVWPLPFNLAVDEATRAGLREGGEAALHDASGRLWGVVQVAQIYQRDPREEARHVYKTDDASHPGVAYLLSRPTSLVGGDVQALPLPEDLPFSSRRLTPRALRQEIESRGWRRVAGFQTRNPIHRAHEHLTKVALEVSDGLVLHPLVGETKSDDVPAAVRFRAYELLLERYYPKERTILSVFPAAMRYAGPREALFHAVVRKNYGITQLIVGRDHAGVGKFYGPLEAQQIFERFSLAELGVAPLKLDPTFFCRRCDGLASARTCPHDGSARLELSGSRVREILREGGSLPREFTRPEVAQILREHYTAGEAPAAKDARPVAVRPTRAQTAAAARASGYIVWFTGLSGAGKSTLANALAERLGERGAVEILDGDEVRLFLSRGLGFSKEDRDTNIRRIGYVARVLARNGVPVITAAISPYADTRLEVRRAAEKEGLRFVEVFASASLDALVQRDVKGLYKKALAGEIEHFTGVSDPYEAPEKPDVLLHTDQETVDQSLKTLLAALEERGLWTPWEEEAKAS